MYVSDADGDDFAEACLPVDLEDDGYNMVHTHDESAAFILADHAEPGSAGPQVGRPASQPVCSAAANVGVARMRRFRRRYSEAGKGGGGGGGGFSGERNSKARKPTPEY